MSEWIENYHFEVDVVFLKEAGQESPAPLFIVAEMIL